MESGLLTPTHLAKVSTNLPPEAPEQFQPLSQFFSTFWPQHTVTKAISYCISILNIQNHPETVQSGSISFAFLDLFSTLFQLMPMDPSCRLFCPPAKNGFGQWEVLAGDAYGSQSAWRGIVLCWLLPACLLWEVHFLLPKITASVRHPSPFSVLEAHFLSTSLGWRM